MIPISTQTAERYTWLDLAGHACDGWHLVPTPALSVIEERMPSMTSERCHYHSAARRFFYVLTGELTLELDETLHILTQNQGLEILPGQHHH